MVLMWIFTAFKLAQELAPHPSPGARPRTALQSLMQTWSPQPHYPRMYRALDPEAKTSVANSPVNFNPSDEYFGLPRTGDYEVVSGFCGSCHSLEIVMQQSLDRDAWKRTLDWMTVEQNMPQLQTHDETLILDYLSMHFGAR